MIPYNSAAATGKVMFFNAGPIDGDSVTIGDGVISKVFEFDHGSYATGTLGIEGIPVDGTTVTISDGTVTKTFEFDAGVKATGTITLTGNPADGNTIVINDGTQAATTFEYDAGVLATGSVTLTANAADGNTVTISDGTNTATVFEFDDGVAATGSLEFANQPSLGQIITISDGTNTPTVFEFDDGGGVEAGRVAVLVGATKEDTMAALITAINGVVGTLLVTASANDPADAGCNLVNDVKGVVGNVQITSDVTNFTANGMSGGLDAGNGPVSGSNTAVAIGATKEASVVNLIAKINGITTGLTVTASASVPADNICNLTADAADTTHNVEITKVGANITVSGMTGGLAPGAGPVTGSNTPIAIGATKEATMVNTIAAINGIVAGLLVTATATDPASNACTLQNANVGVPGNVAITKTGANITVTGMSGGLAAGNGPITAGNIAVASAAAGSATATMAALVVAINSEAAGLGLTATASEPADANCTLANDATGVIGNVPITTTCEELTTVTGMSGGQDAGGTEVTAGTISLPTTGSNAVRAITLANAINVSGLNLIAKAIGQAVLLEHREDGSDGNVTITKSGDAIAVSGMSGGIEPYANIIAQTPIQTNDDLTFKTVATRFDTLTDAIPS